MQSRSVSYFYCKINIMLTIHIRINFELLKIDGNRIRIPDPINETMNSRWSIVASRNVKTNCRTPSSDYRCKTCIRIPRDIFFFRIVHIQMILKVLKSHNRLCLFIHNKHAFHRVFTVCYCENIFHLGLSYAKLFKYSLKRGKC